MADEGHMPTLMDNDNEESDVTQTSSDSSNDDLECVSAGTSSKSVSGQDSTGESRTQRQKCGN